ncbi:hypothetical protein ACFQYP_35425 [Nonomuraea antimicrobica]
METAKLIGTRVEPVPAGVTREWPPSWQVEQGAEGGRTLCLACASSGGPTTAGRST